jgi:hypothetical protein
LDYSFIKNKDETMNPIPLHVDNATVPFFTYSHDGIDFIEFDTSLCIPPEPMVNAMVALERLNSPKTKVVMINHRSPVGLLAKISAFYEIETMDLGDNKLKLIFSYKEGDTRKADLSNKSCAG